MSFSDQMVKTVSYIIETQGIQGLNDLKSSLLDVSAEIDTQKAKYAEGRSASKNSTRRHAS